MTNSRIIAVLPAGKFSDDQIRKEFDAIVRAFGGPETELVIADPVADAEAARQSVMSLSQRNLDLLLIIPLHGLSAQVIEAAALTGDLPCLICPVPGRFALPSSALAIGALREENVPVELLYAPPDHPDFVKRLRTVTSAAEAFSKIRKSRIGIIGNLFPNLVSCRYDPQVVTSRLGVTLVPLSFDILRDSIQAISGNRQEEARKEITSIYKIRSEDGNALEAGIRLHLALKQIAREQNIDGYATECWSGFPKELGLNPCLGFIEDAYTLACEGDVMLCNALLIARYLTGKSAYVGDLYDLTMDGVMTLIHCGASASLATDKTKVVLAKSQLAMQRGFETLTCRPQLQPGPMTIFRFYGRECNLLHLATGELLESKQSPNLESRIKIQGDRWDFLDQCFGNHYVAVTGDIQKELKLLCKWLNITIFETRA